MKIDSFLKIGHSHEQCQDYILTGTDPCPYIILADGCSGAEDSDIGARLLCHTALKYLKKAKGILIPGGFGNRGIEGKIKAAQFARKNNIPYFGICLGMHTAVIEFARNVCGLKNANSTEFIKNTKYPVISLLEEQQKVKIKGATMRLGAYECKLKKNTLSYSAYKKEKILERHRHRYEFNNEFKNMFEKNGMVLSGINPKTKLIELIELKDHPWYVACQFHPEFKSKPDNAHPLFREFVKAALKR